MKNLVWMALLVCSPQLACAFGTAEGKSVGGDGGAGGQAAAASSSSPCVGPDTPAACSACGTGTVCQANGCYNGYLCDTDTNRCRPPDACP